MALSTKSITGTQLELFKSAAYKKADIASGNGEAKRPIDYERVRLELEGLKHGCGCIPLIRSSLIEDTLTVANAIEKINKLSRDTNPELRIYSDRVYKSAIQAAYKATEGNKEKLEEFIEALSFLFKKNEIARALIYDSNAQIEAVYSAAKKLQQAYRRRNQSKERQPGDLNTSRSYGEIANEIKRIFINGKPKDVNSRTIRFRSQENIKRELIAVAKKAGEDKKQEMQRKLANGSSLIIQAVWILNLKSRLLQNSN